MQIQVGDSTADRGPGTWESLKLELIAGGAAVLSESDYGQDERGRTQ